MSGIKQWGLVVAVAGLLTRGLYFTVFKSQRDAERQRRRSRSKPSCRKTRELEAYRTKLAEIERQLASLKQQLEIERRIVPDEKEVDGFMQACSTRKRRRQESSCGATRRSRRRSKEFYTEVPFEMELDGPYYSMLNFFDRVGKLERIVNVSNLLVANTKKPSDAKAKHTYQYAPNESVVATCVATTFFSHDQPAATPATAKGRI